jgi:hypothetical protein
MAFLTIERRDGKRGQAREAPGTKIQQAGGIAEGRVTVRGRRCSRWCSLSVFPCRCCEFRMPDLDAIVATADRGNSKAAVDLPISGTVGGRFQPSLVQSGSRHGWRHAGRLCKSGSASAAGQASAGGTSSSRLAP